jgi:muconolactone delta-isomerase
MLFHVTMTHTADNCPGYEREKLAELVAASEKWDALARELNARVHFVLWGAPEHVAYALIEADSLGAVARYINAIPIRQEFKVTPVQHLQETMTMAKAMLKS